MKTRVLNLQIVRRTVRRTVRMILLLILILGTAGPAAAIVGPGAGLLAPAATTIVVSTYADEINDDGDCSLREAVQAANTDTAVDACPAGTGVDTIILPAGTYYFALAGADEDANATGDLDLTSDITLSGAGAESTVIDAAQLDRVLHVLSGATVVVNGLTLTGGHTPDGGDGDSGYPGDTGSPGGGIHNEGTLTITDSTLSGNQAGAGGDGYPGGAGGAGGGIYNGGAGTLTLTDSTLSDNQAGAGGAGDPGDMGGAGGAGGAGGPGGAGGAGGGIYNGGAGTLTITDGTLSGNQGGAGGAGGAGDVGSSTSGGAGGAGGPGGGIYNEGTVTITDGILSINQAGPGGAGGATIYSGTGGAGGLGGDGGGIYSRGMLTITDSALSGNQAGAGGVASEARAGGAGGTGGGIYNGGTGTLMITRSGLSGNQAGAGGASGAGYGSTGLAGGAGGAGGGIYNAGTLTIANSTLSNNRASTGGAGGANLYGGTGGAGGAGGGIYNGGAGTVTLTNSTLSGNQTGAGGTGGEGGSGGADGPVGAGGAGGGIYRYSGTVDIQNSIVFGNLDALAGTGSDDCSGAITSLGYNLTGASTGCPSGGTGDQTTGDAGLAGFDDEGPAADATHTHALLPGSPALDAIPNGVNGCGTTITTDQRGYARPQNGACDIGAYEAVFSRTWDGDGGDGAWSTGANWTGDERPEEGDHAILASAAAVSLDISPSIGDLTISGVGADLAAGAGYSLLLNGEYVQTNGSFVAPPFLTIYGDWTRDGGSFDPNGGLVRFNGDGTRAIGGAAVTDFYDFTINLESGGSLVLETDINVAGDFALAGGTFDPQTEMVTFSGTITQTISGGPAFYDATVSGGAVVRWPVAATAANVLSNNGTLVQTRDVSGSGDVSFLDTGGYGGVTVNANGTDLYTTTVAIRGNQDCSTTPGETVQRCFQISPAVATGLNADITFYFADVELSGNDCTTLNAYRWNGSDWDEIVPVARQCSSEPYSVTVTGVSDFSHFALKSGGAPTAIAMVDFSARPSLAAILSSPLAVVLSIVGVVPVLLAARRRRQK